jgi:hypothetical protein
MDGDKLAYGPAVETVWRPSAAEHKPIKTETIPALPVLLVPMRSQHTPVIAGNPARGPCPPRAARPYCMDAAAIALEQHERGMGVALLE